jgi:hypothetical protein
MSRHGYYAIIIALLAAILVHRLTHPRHVPPAVAGRSVPHVAYADARVRLTAGPGTLEGFLKDLCSQGQVALEVHWPAAPSADVATRLVVPKESGEMTFAEAVAAVLRTTEGPLVAGYDPGKLVIGTGDDVYGPGRVVTVTYPVQDLIATDDPWTGQSVGWDRVMDLVRLIEDQVSPDAWRERGGTTCFIRERDGNLVIEATPEMQWRIGALLGQMREGG